MIYYRACRIGVPFDNEHIRDSLLNALWNLFGESRGAGAPVAPVDPVMGLPANWSPGQTSPGIRSKARRRNHPPGCQWRSPP